MGQWDEGMLWLFATQDPVLSPALGFLTPFQLCASLRAPPGEQELWVLACTCTSTQHATCPGIWSCNIKGKDHSLPQAVPPTPTTGAWRWAGAPRASSVLIRELQLRQCRRVRTRPCHSLRKLLICREMTLVLQLAPGETSTWSWTK